MNRKYWDYFLYLEEDLFKCNRFVEFARDNELAYSIEFARIIMAASAEIDTVAKEFCSLMNGSKRAGKILEYAEIIQRDYPKIVDVEVKTNNEEISIKPWAKWNKNMSPNWWKEYNDIKHDRNINYQKANMINAISSVSALLVILLYYYHKANNGKYEEIGLFEAPKHLSICESNRKDWEDGGIYWGYIMPN
jgi:hypothetical protein